MDIGIVQELFKIEAARARGESISEFKIARLYVDSMWIELADMLDSGVSKSDVVGVLTITARVNRTAAYNVLSNKINSIENRKRKTNREVSKEGSVKAVHRSAPAVVIEKTAPPAVPSSVQPLPSAQAAEISAITQFDISTNKPAPFSVGIKIGNNFHGVDDVGEQADREREEQKLAMASLEAMEKRLGSPSDFIKRQQQEK